MEPELTLRRRAALAAERRLRQPRLHAGAAGRDRGRAAARWCSPRRSRARRRWRAAASRSAPAAQAPTDADRAACWSPRPGLSAPGRGGDASRASRPTDIPKRHYGKGVYFRLAGRAPFEHLIYPPPIPGALGTHYRKRPRRPGGVRPRPRLRRDRGLHASIPAARPASTPTSASFWPGLPDGALTPRLRRHPPQAARPRRAAAGLPARRRRGRTASPGLVALFGIESPGLTSSLAIGEAVRRRWLEASS